MSKMRAHIHQEGIDEHDAHLPRNTLSNAPSARSREMEVHSGSLEGENFEITRAKLVVVFIN
jgi:hypothetical protein